MKLAEDLKAFAPDWKKKITTILTNPNFHCVCLFRLSGFLYRIHLGVLAKIVWYINRIIFNADIDYRAQLAGGFHLVHGLGTVIGKDVKSQGPLKVYQHVTIGGGNGKSGQVLENGTVIKMPVFGENCVVYTGAIVVGGILIQPGTIIKAGSLIHSNL